MTATIHHGDCLEVLAAMAPDSLDACLTDPPYELGFMGRAWDSTGIAFRPATWAAVLRVLKPGAHLVAFGAPRNYHRLACAIEDAGFEIRDSVMWLFGSGFAKAHNLKNKPELFCSCGGDTVPYDQSNTEHNLRSMRRADLSEAIHSEPQQGEVLFSRLPEQGLSPHRTARADASAGRSEQSGLEGRTVRRDGQGLCDDQGAQAPAGAQKRIRSGAHPSRGEETRPAFDPDRGSASQESQQGGQPPGQFEGVRGPHGTLDGRALRDGHVCPRCGKLPEAFKGFSTALKPAYEPIVLARKPLAGTVAANVLAHGTGALNIDGCRVPTADTINQPSSKGTLCGSSDGWDRPWKADVTAVAARDRRAREAIQRTEAMGRWPANVVHDGSAEVLAAFPPAPGQQRPVRGDEASTPARHVYGTFGRAPSSLPRGDEGSAARFFYCAKADASDRLGSKHPTVKPVDLMAWLCRLVTPPGGAVLDPFAGSGTTGMACLREGVDAVLIEREASYVEDIHRRLQHVSGSDAPLFSRTEASDAA